MRADCTVWPEPGSRLDQIRTVLDPADELAMRLLPEAFDHSMSVNKGRG